MGAKLTVTIINQTPYTWHFSTQNRGLTSIGAGSTTSYQEDYNRNHHINFRYENHTDESFKYEFDTTHKIYWYNVTFIIRETPDHSQIELHCVNDGGSRHCPNYKNAEGKSKKLKL